MDGRRPHYSTTPLLRHSGPVNLNDQQKIRIGACAWSFDEWRGPFYPADLPQSQWLEFYARYFPAVEVDSTFYSAPAEQTLLRWVEATPAAFRFACKLPREITHVCRLRDCTAELNSFLRLIEPLAPKLQVVLIQLPSSFTPKDGKTALRGGFGVVYNAVQHVGSRARIVRPQPRPSIPMAPRSRDGERERAAGTWNFTRQDS